MKYTLQEGSFSLFPAAWQDTSMTMLRDDESGLSLIVSRGAIPDDSDFEKEFQRQWEVLRAQMGEIQQSEFARILVGQPSHRAVEVETAFVRQGQQIWQKQFAVPAPDAPRLLIFTLSALRPFTDEDAERWNTIKQSLTLHK
ncbi:DcrB-related protein [Franconibacter pulveris 1160]|uniref:DcrB-related protein n=1 Tax=Franconibacter pulveris TaxID=435910 RepID=UPI0004653643|nr:DcrB-related protein [Franconibacter pulveris]